jgi:predicted phage-related endonuclease
MTGLSGEKGFVSGPMEWGTETEPLARAAYEVLLDGEWVELSGFVEHPEYPFLGASPDGLVGSDGCIEIKCPNTATHIQTITTRDIEKKYWYQMQTVMLCTGRSWCDFISFDPRLPENCQLFVERVERDNAAQTRIINEAMRADEETNNIIVTLSKYKRPGA